MNDATASGPESRAALAVTWFSDFWVAIGMIVFPILIALSTLFVGKDTLDLLDASAEVSEKVRLCALIATLVFIPMHGFFSIKHLRHMSRESDLRNELNIAKKSFDELRESSQDALDSMVTTSNALIEGYIRDFAFGKLKFGETGRNSERITVYLHNSLSEFQTLTRCSANPLFRKPGRKQYPDSKECIGRAWHDGWHFQVIPNAETNTAEWFDECEKLGIPSSVAGAFKMKSSLYCACSIHSPINSNAIGVVVVESIDRDRWTEQTLKLAMNDNWRKTTGNLVETLKSWLGDNGVAKREGF